MSNALAIASVTQVLKDLLNDGLIDHDVTGTIGGNVTVTALPPDRIEIDLSNEKTQLNLFMYQATHNPGWRNVGFPSHNSGGERISNPPLALDLHYLLTAYGLGELDHEILLGYGMQLFHETPVLSRDAIRTSLNPPVTVNAPDLPTHLRALSTSELADQIEQIKITPEIMNTEEISRLWTAFGAKYRPNAAYKVTVVLIESRKSTKSALPVGQRKIYVVPFKTPTIEKISSKASADAPILDNQKILDAYFIVISGRNLKAEIVTVDIDGIIVTPTADALTDSKITIPLPSSLQSGIHGVQVVQDILMGSPPVAHQGVSSNVQALVLHPRIETAVPGLNNIQLTVKPAISYTQRVVLFLNELKPILSPPDLTPPLAYSFTAPPITILSPPDPFESISILISGVRPGTYLVRIQVDGAESPLQTDVAGRYNGPQVTIS